MHVDDDDGGHEFFTSLTLLLPLTVSALFIISPSLGLTHAMSNGSQTKAWRLSALKALFAFIPFRKVQRMTSKGLEKGVKIFAHDSIRSRSLSGGRQTKAFLGSLSFREGKHKREAASGNILFKQSQLRLLEAIITRWRNSCNVKA